MSNDKDSDLLVADRSLKIIFESRVWLVWTRECDVSQNKIDCPLYD